MRVLLLICSLMLVFILQAQNSELENSTTKKDYYQYDDDFLPASFHQGRRDSLRKLMPENAVAVFFSAPERLYANDVYYEFHQDPNFYYLSGLREPNSMLIVFKELQTIDGEQTNEILFVQPRNPDSEIWNGRRMGKAGAEAKMGFKTIKLNVDFQKMKLPFDQMEKVYYQKPLAMEEQEVSKTTTLAGLVHHFKEKLEDDASLSQRGLSVMMAKLRQVKTPEEIALLRKAIDITCKAQNELMKQINEDMAEYQTEAIIEYVFKSNGAEYPGFPSIQGSGENSCILHYTSNRRPLKNGGLLVSDVGAEYRGYTADVTRTIPPDGKFSKEEKQIYNLVLKAQQAGIDAAKEGESFWAPHLAAQAVIADGLKKLGIIKNRKEVGQYFMHGTSHYLGLDVHDAGTYMPLQVNNVITVEPGIYIAEDSDCDEKWWNIGVRIEDDILITAEGPENLSAASPRKISEIEKLLKR